MHSLLPVMNPTSADPIAPPPQPPRSSFSCDRHPNEHYSGFCPSCLCERLTSLDHSSLNTPSSSHRPSSASTAAIKSLFSSTSKTSNPLAPKSVKPGLFFPELRRSKSFSASRYETLGISFEPQRKSCDVRVRNTLWSLFTLEDENKTATNDNRLSTSASTSYQNHLNSQRIETCVVNNTVLEETENDEDFNDIENVGDGVTVIDYGIGGESGTRPIRNSNLDNLVNPVQVEVKKTEIVVEEVVKPSISKPAKDHIHVDNQQKKSSRRVFWAAASVFSRKWQKWRQKEKIKKRNINDKNPSALPVEKPISRHYRETQSEIADYGFGRRSCDTDPRFSLDAGRISLDDPRYSFDEPRASWDGYIIGRTLPKLAPMLSVLEDAPIVHVLRSDMHIPVEGEVIPGGNEQTREYYSDSSSKRRKSLDRSSSIRKTAAAVVAEIDELKMVTNAKVSPATTDYFNGPKVLVGERDFRDSNSNSLRDDCSETFELGNGYRESSNFMISSGERKESKKSRRWSWRLWGFIYRRGAGNKEEGEEEKSSISNVVDRSFSESWHAPRGEGNGDVRDRLNRHMSRSNSSASMRNHSHISRSYGSVKKPNTQMNGHGRKKRDEFVLERNRSARYSPSHIDNGLLRFYLTPMRSSRRVGLGKIKSNHSQSIRSVLRLY